MSAAARQEVQSDHESAQEAEFVLEIIDEEEDDASGAYLPRAIPEQVSTRVPKLMVALVVVAALGAGLALI